MKRYLYIIIGIVVAAVVVILIFFLIKSRSAGPSLVISNTPTGSLPITGTQGTNGTGASGGASSTVSTLGLSPITGNSTPTTTSGQMAVQNFGVLSSDPVLNYFVDPQNNIIAIEPTGEVIKISSGQSTVMNSSTIDNVISASFSYDGKKILVNYGDPSNPQSGVFDVATNAWAQLPQGMMSPQWSPSSNYQIAYLATTNSGKLALATMDAANLKAAPSVVFALNAIDLTLQWPTKNEFILSDKPTFQSNGSVWAFNAQTGALSSIVYNIPGAESIWSDNTAFPYGLVSFDTNSATTLQLQTLSGASSTESLTFSTLPSKCAFNTELMPIATSTPATTTSTASSTAKKAAPAKNAPTSTPYLALYCGVPRSSSGFSSAHLPDDYNTMALFTSDDIYKVNITADTVQSLWSDETQNVDVSDVKFFNNALFFVNRYDQKLYGLTFN